MSLRIAGAGIFGLLGDYFGRKWPLVFNLFFLGGLQIASIYVNDIENFLRLRAVFGIAMGGIYGNAASNLMETAPSESRGLLGGIFQAGAAASGLTSAAINLGVGPTPISWHKMFWISAGLSFGVGIIRILIPESKQFIEAAKRKKESLHGQTYKERFIKFCKEFRKMLLLHWQTFVYCCLFVTLFQWAVHTFADNYVTFLIVSKGMSNSRASKITMITKAGCILGVMTMGWLGEYIGRRRMAAISALLAALTLPASIMPTSFSGLAAGGFFYQFFFETYGAILAAHLNELSPIAFRAVMPGIAYQFGASVSAPSAMIVNDIAEGKFVMENGKRVEAYEPVIGAIMGIVYFFQIIFSLFGPEKRGADLAHFKPAGFEDDEELPIAHHLPERGKAESDDKDEK
ncbi:hypothetical protein L7F22_068096 [Adiantum nelumboides]|nr:hypothetical protein [Adiantum nelumboides]